MPDTLKLTLVQTDIVWEDKKKNIENLSRKIDSLSEKGHIIILPEMFATGFTMNPEKMAEPENGDTFNWMLRTARKTNSALVGSVVVEENGTFYNRLYWVEPSGNYRRYDKKHLFSFAGEDKRYAAGSEKIIIEYMGWRICPLICYDLRFPVWSRNNENYDLLIYVANWPMRRSHAWKTLLTARAIENMCYVAGVNRTGTDAGGIEHSGNSLLIDYAGIAKNYFLPFTENTSTFSVSKPALIEFREKFNFLKDADKFKILDNN